MHPNISVHLVIRRCFQTLFAEARSSLRAIPVAEWHCSSYLRFPAPVNRVRKRNYSEHFHKSHVLARRDGLVETFAAGVAFGSGFVVGGGVEI